MYKFKKIIACLDMAGCPNRCKHCWLGTAPNGDMTGEDLLYISQAFRPFTEEFEISSWYREPDFRGDYKELWDFETKLSDNKKSHFELISFWRMVRDDTYADWLYSLGVRICQLTLFGTEETTDNYVGRKGAFKEIISTIDILLRHHIAPRIQIFINKQNIKELPYIEALITKLDLVNRCKEIGQEFALFLHQGSCDGENEKLYNIRITKDDLKEIPDYLVKLTLRHCNCSSLSEIFGKPENVLIKELLEDTATSSIVSETPVFYINCDFDVFPNETQPSNWWCLGNVKRDGINQVIKNYQNNNSVAQRLISTVTISEMVRLCGNPDSLRLFTKGDYIIYIWNQYCKFMCKSSN